VKLKLDSKLTVQNDSLWFPK